MRRRRTLAAAAPALLAGAAFLASAALADPGPDATRVWSATDWRESPWVRRPTHAESDRLMPPAVRDAHVMMSADLRCRVTGGGGFAGCVVDWEQVTGVGMDKAALAALALSRIRTRLHGVGPTAGLYARLTVIFDAGGDGPPHDLIPTLHALANAPMAPATHPFDRRERQTSGG